MDQRIKVFFDQLDRIGKIRARKSAAAWTAVLCGGASVLLLAYHLADLLLMFPPGYRIVFGWALLALSAAGVTAAVFSFSFRKSRKATASWLEARDDTFRQDISTVVQCAGREGYSEELISELAGSCHQRLGSNPPDLYGNLGRVWAASALALIVAATVFLIWPDAAKTSLARLVRPWGVIGDWSEVEIAPGDARVPAGEKIVVTVQGVGGRPRIYLENAGRSSILRFEGSELTGYSFCLPPAQDGFNYRLFIGRMQSRNFKVTVFKPLELEDIGVVIVPPAYTGMTTLELPNQGSIEAVKGSRAVVTARPSGPVESAEALFSDGAAVAGTQKDGRLIFPFTVRRDGAYRLMAVSSGGADTFLSAEYRITAVPDQPPRAELFGDDSPALLGSEMEVSIEGRAGDDFGLTRLGIGYLLHGRQAYHPMASFRRIIPDTVIEAVWSLANMGLLPGDSLVYWLEAADNDGFAGPKTGRSRSRKLWVPGIAEMYREMARRDSAATAELSAVRPEQAKLKGEIQRLSQAIKETRRLDWQQQAAIEKALGEQQELLSRLERAADQALESLRPQGRRLEIDAETASKLRELHQLFDQVASDEMRRAIERLSQALEKMDRQEVAKALEKMNLTADELNRQLDQAIAALRELQQQRQLDRMAEKLERLAEEQRDIRKGTRDSLGQNEAERLTRRQQQAAEDLEALTKEVRQLGEQMESQPEAGERLKQAVEKIEKKGTPSKMRQAAQRISQGDNRSAWDLQQQALHEMSELSLGLESARSSMKQARGRARAQAMMRKAREALSLSQQQEELNRIMRQGGSTNELAQRQQALARDGARMQSRAGTQPEIMLPPQAAASLGRAVRAMNQSCQDIMGGRAGQACQQGQEAVAALNQAAAAMLEASSRRSGSQGGGDMMQDLEGLSGQQAEINQQTMGIMPSPGGQQEALSQEARSQMARLAAQQEAVRQGLEEFERKYADRGDRAGRLDDLAEEMRQVAEDLRQQRIDERTRERQERILNRLLQAQRSLRDQDFSQQRQAEPGKDPGQAAGRRSARSGGPPPPPPDHNWRDEPFPIEYREVIEKYFRSLGW